MADDAKSAPLVGGGGEAEEELGGGEVEGRKAQFVEDDQVRAQEVVDDLANRVVGEAAIERLDEVGGGEIADAQTGMHGGMAETNEQGFAITSIQIPSSNASPAIATAITWISVSAIN